MMLFAERPLLKWSREVAKATTTLGRMIVSTDKLEMRILMMKPILYAPKRLRNDISLCAFKNIQTGS